MQAASKAPHRPASHFFFVLSQPNTMPLTRIKCRPPCAAPSAREFISFQLFVNMAADSPEEEKISISTLKRLQDRVCDEVAASLIEQISEHPGATDVEYTFERDQSTTFRTKLTAFLHTKIAFGIMWVTPRTVQLNLTEPLTPQPSHMPAGTSPFPSRTN